LGLPVHSRLISIENSDIHVVISKLVTNLMVNRKPLYIPYLSKTISEVFCVVNNFPRV